METTFKEYIKANKKEIVFLAISASLLLLTSLFFLISGEKSNVPQDFEDARVRAVDLSAQIVDRANQSRIALIEIANKDGLGDYNSALVMVQEELNQIEKIYSEASKLNNELTIMSENLKDIKPVSAREIGLSATLRAVNLVEGLISYNNSMKDLLKTLEQKLSGVDTGSEVNQLIDKINSEIKAVNSANTDYQSLMKAFRSLADIS